MSLNKSFPWNTPQSHMLGEWRVINNVFNPFFEFAENTFVEDKSENFLEEGIFHWCEVRVGPIAGIGKRTISVKNTKGCEVRTCRSKFA